jgi:hypothetical protein
MPVTSAASWYCSEYMERDTRRKSKCQYSNVVVGIVHMGPRFVRCLFGQLCILSGDKGELQIGEMVLHVAQ